jgi:hypothetical protein
METLVLVSQLIVSLSVAYVWIFRYPVVVQEFKDFGLSELTRSFVGASKISIATLLAAGIWYPALTPFSAVLMALFMLAAQYFHFKVTNPISKRVPSFLLLALCLFIFGMTYQSV